ncbi:MAG: FHA domain-containing protein [Candidatus Competibacteraceae bacterium]|jgi:hypothetical protein|nr:FHA domain-containing protein [Candidatus Competibacteraceae bacterium]
MAIRRDRKGRVQTLNDGINTPPTRPLERQKAERAESKSADSDEKLPEVDSTRLFHGGTGPEAQEKGMQDPVVGWLVITEGPGRGRVLNLGYGLNSIGRGPKVRAQLDFGDLEISRNGHAAIVYDPRGRRFYLQHGGGTNLTYLNDQPVLAPQELTGHEIILIGQTQLHFVPFCGPDFDWQDDKGD